MATKAKTLNVSTTRLASIYAATLANGSSTHAVLNEIASTGITLAMLDTKDGKSALNKVAKAAKAGWIAAEYIKAHRLNGTSGKVENEAERIATAKASDLNATELKWRRNIADKNWSRCVILAGLKNEAKAHGAGAKAKSGKATDKAADPDTQSTIAKPTSTAPVTIKSTSQMLERAQALAAEISALCNQWKDNPQAKPIVEFMIAHTRAMIGFKPGKVETVKVPEPIKTAKPRTKR